MERIGKEGVEMKVAALQCTAVLGEVERNYAHMAEMIKEAVRHGADLVVLPEMWNTGFYPENVADLADEDGARTKAMLIDAAKTYHVHIVGGSVACRRDGNLYNTTYVVNREGRIVGSYDKVHLFTMGHEDQVFTAGDQANVFSLDDIPMASMICYDLRFCEWARVAALRGAVVLFVPAAWPIERLRHWQILNTARAIENQCFVVAVNACGQTGTYDFAGHSMIINPLGDVLVEGGHDEGIFYADIQPEEAGAVRQRLHALADRRPDIYRKGDDDTWKA